MHTLSGWRMQYCLLPQDLLHSTLSPRQNVFHPQQQQQQQQRQ
jgi:hypothetical protein